MFQADQLYSPHDDALRIIAKVQTLAHWRCTRRGPSYIKIGSKILYKGESLNRFLSNRTVETSNK